MVNSRDFTYVDDIVEGIYLSSISKKELIDPNFDSMDPSRSFVKVLFLILEEENQKILKILLMKLRTILEKQQKEI